MKRLKQRLLSLLMAMCLMTTLVISATACGKKTTGIIMGQWLAWVDDAFGMTTYRNDTPYFGNITADNTYFEAVQIATEWNVVDTDDELDVNKEITWREALVTLVNCGRFLEEDASEDEKIEYGIDHLNSEIRDYWLDRTVKEDDALELLDTAVDLWAKPSAEDTKAEVDYKEDVVDYTAPDHFVSDYEVADDGSISIPAEQAGDIQAGDVYSLPSKDGTGENIVYKAENVKTDKDGNVIIKNSDKELELGDIYEKLNVAETLFGDESNIVIRDGAGNIIYSPEEGVRTTAHKGNQTATTLGATPGGNVIQTGNADVKFSFTLPNDFKVSGGFKFSSTEGLTLKADVTTGNFFKDSQASLKGTLGFEVSNLTATQNIDYDFGSLKGAKLVLNYKAKEYGKLELSTDKMGQFTLAPYRNSEPSFFKNLFAPSTRLKSATSNARNIGEKTIKIASVDLFGYAAKVCLDVNLNISASGTASITFTQSGNSGVEYVNGNLRCIKIINSDVDLEMRGKAETTVSLGPAIYVFGLRKKVIGVSVAAGVGIEAGFDFDLVDGENHLIEESGPIDSEDAALIDSILQNKSTTIEVKKLKEVAASQGAPNYKAEMHSLDLHIDTCVTIDVYKILKIQLDSNSVASDVFNLKAAWNIWDKSNACFMKVHIDGWGKGNIHTAFGGDTPQCTKKYTPFTDDEEDTEDPESTQDHNVEFGDSILLDHYRVSGAQGDGITLSIVQLPEGYSLSDIRFRTSDASVASVGSKSGNVTFAGEGNCVITAYTTDGKYYQDCAVTVTSEWSVPLDPL